MIWKDFQHTLLSRKQIYYYLNGMKRSKESVYALFVYRAIDYLWTDIAFWDGMGRKGEGTVASLSKSSVSLFLNNVNGLLV